MYLVIFLSYTAIIQKGKLKYVALCPELDVASQGNSIEQAIKNLKEAVELYIEEMGEPAKYSGEKIIVNFEVKKHGKTARPVRF